MKRIVSIQDISCLGKCSLTVALPIISAMGVETCVVPTAVLSTHTGGFSGFTFHDLTQEIQPISDHWQKEGIAFDAIYTGYLGSFEQIQLVSQFFDRFGGGDTLVYADPAMADNGVLYTGFTPEFALEMGKLCGKADVIVPNLTEACFLTDTKYENVTEKDYPTILSKLKRLCPRPSVTGCDEVRDGSVRSAVFYTDEKGELKSYATEKIEGAFHGAGDVYASALVGALARGIDMDKAVEISAEFTKNSIAQTKKDGTEARYGLNSESQMLAFLENIDKAAK